jgi:DNA invertase Pin-like site-specific DNA recombinase
LPPRVVVREAASVERLAYTRSQAAQALGISRSTLRRLLPYIETIEMPWGTSLIPVDELEQLAAERRRPTPPSRHVAAPKGRKPSVPAEVVERIRAHRSAGRSLRQIADALNADRIPTAHGGERWWPSTVHALLWRAA